MMAAGRHGKGEVMSVLVQMTVRAPDPERFIATAKRFEPMMQEMGARNQAVYAAEHDPNELTTMSEWDSHDDMHAASEKHGDQFNDEAGTTGLEWTTRIWHRR
jgi:quinol monooxygenase YgiN